MDEIKLLIVDDNINLIKMLKEFFKKSNKVKIVAEAYNGEDGLDLIQKEYGNFDVVLLDLIMPKKDGLWVLEQCQEKNLNLNVIVESSYNAANVISEAANYGANYFVLKPFDLEELQKRIIDATMRKKENLKLSLGDKELLLYVTKLLHQLGIPSHIKGYQYLRDSILILYHKPELIGGITKELYPEIAIKYDTTVSRVERAIRHAIELSCNRANCDVIQEYFVYSINYLKSKPTNSEFMVTIADKLRLEHERIKQEY